MEHNDRPRFASLMKAHGETFGNTAPSKEKMEIYFRALSEFTIEQMDEAIIHIIKTRKITSTFPVPGEISEAIGGDVGSAAIIALDKAEKAAATHGSYKSVQFDDPVIHMVITAMGGWYKFCCPAAYGDPQDWHWKAKEFKSIYETFSRRQTADCPTVLYGLSDTNNGASGAQGLGRLPVQIGDQKKIEQWTVEAKKNRQIEVVGTTENSVKKLVGAVVKDL
jgi:hypothetical protein